MTTMDQYEQNLPIQVDAEPNEQVINQHNQPNLNTYQVLLQYPSLNSTQVSTQYLRANPKNYNKLQEYSMNRGRDGRGRFIKEKSKSKLQKLSQQLPQMVNNEKDTLSDSLLHKTKLLTKQQNNKQCFHEQQMIHEQSEHSYQSFNCYREYPDPFNIQTCLKTTDKIQKPVISGRLVIQIDDHSGQKKDNSSLDIPLNLDVARKSLYQETEDTHVFNNNREAFEKITNQNQIIQIENAHQSPLCTFFQGLYQQQSEGQHWNYYQYSPKSKEERVQQMKDNHIKTHIVEEAGLEQAHINFHSLKPENTFTQNREEILLSQLTFGDNDHQLKSQNRNNLQNLVAINPEISLSDQSLDRPQEQATLNQLSPQSGTSRMNGNCLEKVGGIFSPPSTIQNTIIIQTSKIGTKFLVQKQQSSKDAGHTKLLTDDINNIDDQDSKSNNSINEGSELVNQTVFENNIESYTNGEHNCADTQLLSDNIQVTNENLINMRTRQNGRRVVNNEDFSQIPLKVEKVNGDLKPLKNICKHASLIEQSSNDHLNLISDDSPQISNLPVLSIMNNQSYNVQSEFSQKNKKQGQNMFADCLKIYKNMFMFDWDLKDIVNSRHSPKEDLTTGAFWFYFNTTYFPHDLQQLVTQIPFSSWYDHILKNLNTFRLPHSLPDCTFPTTDHSLIPSPYTLSNNKIRYHPPSPCPPLPSSVPSLHHICHIDKLIGKRKRFQKFKSHMSHLYSRAQTTTYDEEVVRYIQTQAREIPADIGITQWQVGIQGELEADIEIRLIKDQIQKVEFQKMVYMAEQDLQQIQQDNYNSVKDLYGKVEGKYRKALRIRKDEDQYYDNVLYKGEDIAKYGQEFLAHVDPAFVQDMVKNQEWYEEHLSQFLMNINYPCKLQTDCLKMIELSQQRRNDQKYRKILDQMDQIDHIKIKAEQGDQIAIQELKNKEIEIGIQQLSLHQRAQIAQEDACCAICGVGDYEDDDQIVFCVRCSMPVHQSCFGIETIPEIDWICNNCFTYGFQRGLMIKCILCPKRGGAMKPTNIFSSQEKYFEQKMQNISRKQGKKNIEKLNIKMQENLNSQPNIDKLNDNNDLSKQSVMRRLENNTSLAELLMREVSYKERTLKEYDDRLTEMELSKKDISFGCPYLTESMLIIKKQEEFELNFNKHEKQNHNIPEDYCNFIKQNETILEMKNCAITDTLYHWVHHSCSMWMKEPVVTPKTPVKMNKMDFSKFNQGCVICGKKGYSIGACVKCQKQECQIYFHVECAKRANYCMEIEKKVGSSNRERVFKVFCESHRPFKIIQVINEQNQKEIDDIQKFTKTIEKSMEIQLKHMFKPKKLISKSDKNKMLRQALINKKQEISQLKKESKLQLKPKKDKKEKPTKAKKWREVDRKNLMSRVKEKYLTIMKMRLNLIKIDPMIAENKKYQKELKRIQKQDEKKRKQEIQIKQQIEFKHIMQERDCKIQERGLRNRIKTNDDDPNFNDSHDQQQAFEIDFQNQEMQINDQQNNESNIEQSIRLQNISDNMMSDPEGLQTNEQLILDNDFQDDENDSDIKLEDIEQFNNEICFSNLTNNKITLNLEPLDGEEEIEQSFTPGQTTEIFPELKEIPEYYKHATLLTISELEWTVTLSRYDFPWNEVCFESFTPKDCYRMYRSIVKDGQSFLKKVLGEKLKFQRMMFNQLNGLPLIDTMMNMKVSKKHKSMFESNGHGLNQMVSGTKSHNHTFGTYGNGKLRNLQNNSPGAIFDVTHMNQNNYQQLGSIVQNEGVLINPCLYCKCKGFIQQEFMVACESGEEYCINGGWLHPQCTKDLCSLTQEQIDDIEVWYCEDCIQQRKIDKQEALTLVPIDHQQLEFGISLDIDDPQGKFERQRTLSLQVQLDQQKHKSRQQINNLTPTQESFRSKNDSNQSKSLIVSIDQLSPNEKCQVKVDFKQREKYDKFSQQGIISQETDCQNKDLIHLTSQFNQNLQQNQQRQKSLFSSVAQNNSQGQVQNSQQYEYSRNNNPSQLYTNRQQLNNQQQLQMIQQQQQQQTSEMQLIQLVKAAFRQQSSIQQPYQHQIDPQHQPNINTQLLAGIITSIAQGNTTDISRPDPSFRHDQHHQQPFTPNPISDQIPLLGDHSKSSNHKNPSDGHSQQTQSFQQPQPSLQLDQLTSAQFNQIIARLTNQNGTARKE